MDEAGSKLLRGLLEVFLLETLEREPKHGYAILKEMADSFGVEPNRNRLYPLLGKFVKDGWVREVNEAGGSRTIYSLTDAGRAQLQAYRKLPRAFRQSLERVWNLETRAAEPEPAAAPAAPAAPVPVRVVGAPPARPAAAAPQAPPAAAPHPAATPAQPASTLAGPAAAPAQPVSTLADPYPCPDARLAFTKNPRSGDLTLTLTGCPMGAYEYCPKCPIFEGVQGIRRVAFPF